jgi:hypothetical protein
MKRTCLLLATIMLFGVVGTAFASSITYTETVTATGTFNDEDFTNALVTISWTGDTAGVSCLAGFCTNQAAPGTVLLNVQGFGMGFFNDAVDVFDNQTFKPLAAAGFADGPSILDTFNAAFASYDLKTAIGPITGGSFINSGLIFSTSGGDFSIFSAGDATFTATTGTTTPEPGTLALFASGIVGLAGMLRRKINL